MSKRIIGLALVVLLFSSCSTDPEERKQRLLESGNTYYENGRLREASIVYQQAIALDRRFGEAYYRLGLVSLDLGQISPALGALTRACELQPENQDAYEKVSDLLVAIMANDPAHTDAYITELGRLTDRAEQNFPKTFAVYKVHGLIAMAQKTPDQAVEYFKLALAQKPDDLSVALSLANALDADDRSDEAEQFARDFIDKTPTALKMYDYLYAKLYQPDPDGALEVLLSKQKANPGDLATTLQVARHYANTGKRAEMARVLDGWLNGDNTTTSVAYRSIGQFYVLAGDFDRGVEIYRNGEEKFPDDKVEFDLLMVEALSGQGRSEEAYKLVQSIVEEHPNNEQALAMRGALRLRGGTKDDIQAAINDLEASLSQMPDNVVVRYNLGQAYLAMGNRDRAVIEFQQAIDRRPDYLAPRYGLALIYLTEGDYQKVVAATDEILKIRPEEDRAQLLRSYAWVSAGDTQQARSTLEQMLVREPGSAEPTYQLARLNLIDKNFNEAERLYGDMVDAQPADPRGILGLAEVRALTGRREDGIRLLDQQLSKDGDNAAFWKLAKGVAAARWGMWSLAEDTLGQIVQAQPDNQQAQKHLAYAYYQTGQTDQALAAFRKAIELEPNDPAPHVYEGLILMHRGDYAGATASYERVLELSPTNAVALTNLAWILTTQNGDLDRALTLCQRALSVNQGNKDISYTMAQVYIKKNLNDSAVRILDGLVSQDPKRVDWRYHLGLALFQMGNYDRARQELQTALSNSPTQEQETEIRRLLARVNA